MFYILMLEQNITKKEQAEKISEINANNSDNKKYKTKGI